MRGFFIIMNTENENSLKNEARNLCDISIDLCTSMILLYNNYKTPIALIEKMKWEKKLEHWLNYKKIIK